MGLGIFIVSQLLILWSRGWAEMKRLWRESLAIGVAAVFVGWLGLYAWSTIVTVYEDHEVLAAKAATPPPKCPTCPTCSTCPPPTVTTRTVSVPTPVEEPHKCWMTNHFEFPGPRKEKVLTATTVIIHCNYRIEAPFVVRLTFAEDNFIGGDTAYLPDEGMVMGGGGFKQGRMSVAKVQSPSLPAQELVTILALGTTDQVPRAISYAIESK
jgi:hypothetical protein